jgi:hypothetical protein
MSEITHNASNLVRGIWTSAILSGLLAAVVGVVILAWPQPSVVAAAVFFGVYLVVSGIALVFRAFALPVSNFRATNQVARPQVRRRFDVRPRLWPLGIIDIGVSPSERAKS